MPPKKKRELNEAEWQLIFVSTRKSLERIFKSRGELPVLPELVVRPHDGGVHLGGHPRYYDNNDPEHFGWVVLRKVLASIISIRRH